MKLTSKRIKVVNVSKEKCTHYCGRGNWYKGNGKNCSALGNPYGLTSRSREESIRLYEENFKEILTKPGAFEAIELIDKDSEIMEIKLGCFCKPKSCHCDVIAKHFMNAWTR